MKVNRFACLPIVALALMLGGCGGLSTDSSQSNKLPRVPHTQLPDRHVLLRRSGLPVLAGQTPDALLPSERRKGKRPVGDRARFTVRTHQ